MKFPSVVSDVLYPRLVRNYYAPTLGQRIKLIGPAARIDKYIHSTLLHHCLHNDNHANHIGVCDHTRNVARVARPFPLAYKPQHIEWERGNGSSWPD